MVRTSAVALQHLNGAKDIFDIRPPPAPAAADTAAGSTRRGPAHGAVAPKALCGAPEANTAPSREPRELEVHSETEDAVESSRALAIVPREALQVTVCAPEEAGASAAPSPTAAEVQAFGDLAVLTCPLTAAPFASQRCVALVPCGHVVAHRHAPSHSEAASACCMPLNRPLETLAAQRCCFTRR